MAVLSLPRGHVQWHALNWALVVLASRSSICPSPSKLTISEVMGWEAMGDVFRVGYSGDGFLLGHTLQKESAASLPVMLAEHLHEGALASGGWGGPPADPGCPSQSYAYALSGCRQSGTPWGGERDSPHSLGLCYLGRLLSFRFQSSGHHWTARELGSRGAAVLLLPCPTPVAGPCPLGSLQTSGQVSERLPISIQELPACLQLQCPLGFKINSLSPFPSADPSSSPTTAPS